MTAKQKVELVAAQYAAKARAMTRQGDVLCKLAEMLDEDRAAEVFEELQAQGLIDSEGLLVSGRDFGSLSTLKTGLS